MGHLLLGLVDVGAGVIALAWPGPTALVLVLLVGAWAAIGGWSRSTPASGPANQLGPAPSSS